MSRKNVTAIILIPLLLLALSSYLYAQETCAECGDVIAESVAAPAPHNWINLGVAFEDVSDSKAALGRYGEYPQDWLTSGRLNLGSDTLRKERFELRWWDVSADNGRAWNRIALHPVTLEWDAAIFNSYAWDTRDGINLQPQQSTADSITLRIHRGELDNMRLGYERGEVNRRSGGLLGSYQFDRFDYQYNFKLQREGKLRGQFKTNATQYDAPVAGIDGGKIMTSTLKLDSQLGCDWDAYARASQTTFKYSEMADEQATGNDTTLGLRWRPTNRWELETNYRAKNNADDNVVGSHLTGLNELGFSVACVPCNGNRYEAGYSHSSLDYSRLQTEDPAVEDLLLRHPSVATPGQLAGKYDTLSPEQDRYWLNLRQKFGRRVNFSSKVDYVRGDAPETTVPVTYSPSLFSNKRVKHTETLSYSYDPCNQFDLTYHSQKAFYDSRDVNYGLDYMEGSWTHDLGHSQNLLFAYRVTHSNIDNAAQVLNYATNDRTYLANYSRELDNFRYALDFSLTDGSGYEDYRQTAWGADLGFKRAGPLGLRVDWIDRQYGLAAGLDTQALELALTYKIDF